MLSRQDINDVNTVPETEPQIAVQAGEGPLYLAVSGNWTIQFAGHLDKLLKNLSFPGQKRNMTAHTAAEFDLTQLDELDTTGAWLLHRTKSQLETEGITVQWKGMRREFSLLLEEIETNSQHMEIPQQGKGVFMRFMDDVLVRGIAGLGNDVMQLLNFLGAVFTGMVGLLLRPGRFRWFAFVHHLEFTGFRAVPIISLICFLIGAVIMQQSIVQLQRFGADIYAIQMMSILSLREVGFLLTAIMVAGRSGSAYTAEIGAMKMREEIDAMRTLGISPMETLILPRLSALLVMLPILTFIGDFMCLVGGSLMAYFYLSMTPEIFLDQLFANTHVNHFYAGLIKAPFAALAIALVGALEGMKVEGSAESLGNRVTSSVVKAIFLVIIIDAVFAMFFVAINF